MVVLQGVIREACLVPKIYVSHLEKSIICLSQRLVLLVLSTLQQKFDTSICFLWENSGVSLNFITIID